MGKVKVEATKFIYKGIDSAIKGFKEIRILSKESFFTRLISSNANLVLKSELKSSLIKDSPRYVFEFAIVTAAIILVLVTNIKTDNTSSFLPTIAIFTVAALIILPGISLIVSCLSRISYCREAVKTVYEDLKKFSNIKKDNINKGEGYDTKSFQSIKIQNVNFKYKNSDKYVFENVNFFLNENDCIGIIGDSGAGKTTIADILLGLLTPNDGKIFINGKLVSDFSSNLLGSVAYLPQEALILDESLKTNITLETDNEKIDLEKLNLSLLQSNLRKLVNSLTDGVETKIGDGGIRLSGGQNKRVALARVFYHGKKIMIMDEATSSLDPDAEKYIVEQLKEIKGKKTIVIITHRTKTLENCDKIYKVENKKINQFRP